MVPPETLAIAPPTFTILRPFVLISTRGVYGIIFALPNGGRHNLELDFGANNVIRGNGCFFEI